MQLLGCVQPYACRGLYLLQMRRVVPVYTHRDRAQSIALYSRTGALRSVRWYVKYALNGMYSSGIHVEYDASRAFIV